MFLGPVISMGSVRSTAWSGPHLLDADLLLQVPEVHGGGRPSPDRQESPIAQLLAPLVGARDCARRPPLALRKRLPSGTACT